MQENEKKIKAILCSTLWQVWANFCSLNFLLTKAKLDEFNYLQFLKDDCELLEADEVLLGEFPTFSVQFDEYLKNLSYTSALDLCDPESSNNETNPEPPQKVQNVDSTRFPEISSVDIEELKAVAVNKNTSRSTKKWMNLFKSWYQSCHLENVNIEIPGGGGTAIYGLYRYVPT